MHIFFFFFFLIISASANIDNIRNVISEILSVCAPTISKKKKKKKKKRRRLPVCCFLDSEISGRSYLLGE